MSDFATPTLPVEAVLAACEVILGVRPDGLSPDRPHCSNS